MNIPDVLWLSVKLVVVNAGVVNAIFLTTGDTDLHLEPETEGSHALEIFYAGGNVVLLGLF